MSWKHRLHCKSGKEEKKCFVKQMFARKKKKIKIVYKIKRV